MYSRARGESIRISFVNHSLWEKYFAACFGVRFIDCSIVSISDMKYFSFDVLIFWYTSVIASFHSYYCTLGMYHEFLIV